MWEWLYFPERGVANWTTVKGMADKMPMEKAQAFMRDLEKKGIDVRIIKL